MISPAPIDSAQLGAPAVRTFLNIAQLWDLSNEEQALLLGHNLATLSDLRTGALAGGPVSLPPETFERLGAIFGIYRSLMELLPTDKARAHCLRVSNKSPIFSGRSALDVMTEADINGILMVLRYFKAEVHG
jgi:hypothetical protein